MGERKAFGMKEKTPKGFDRVAYTKIGDRFVAAFVIYLVAYHGVIDVGHVDADLVCTAGFYLDVQQRELGVTLSNLPKRECGAAVGGNLHPEAVVVITRDPGFDRSRGFVEHSVLK